MVDKSTDEHLLECVRTVAEGFSAIASVENPTFTELESLVKSKVEKALQTINESIKELK